MAELNPTYLGTPVLSNVEFTAPEKDYRLPGFDFEDNGSYILNDVLVSVRQTKNIVKTQLVRPQGGTDRPGQEFSSERNWGYIGTVKEYISMGDYRIELQGVLTGEEIDEYPEKRYNDLLEYLEFPGDFMASGRFINPYEFAQVIVSDYTISEQKGYNGQIPFRITLLSDDYITVKYNPAQSPEVVQV